MPTKPVSELLDRELDQSLAETLAKFSALLEESVNYGTHLVASVGKAARRRGDEALVVTLLLRHALEIIDSISVLVRSSSIDPCAILLRALLESFFSTEYVIKGMTPQDRMKRARCFIVWHIHNELKWLDKLDAKTQQGKQFKALMQKDVAVKNLQLSLPATIVGSIKSREKLLQSPQYIKIEKEYQIIRKKNPNWFSLFGGPKTIQELSVELGRPGLYEIYYRIWSGTAHGTSLIRRGKVSPGKKGKADIVQLRLAAEAQAIVRDTLIIILGMYRSYIARYIPVQQQEFSKWYVKEIRSGFQRLGGNSIINYKDL